jgi:hypothetical protein
MISFEQGSAEGSILYRTTVNEEKDIPPVSTRERDRADIASHTEPLLLIQHLQHRAGNLRPIQGDQDFPPVAGSTGL